MATAQQIQFAETIRAMKLAMKRRPDIDSDSDTSIHAPTNRGHKLQRRAKFVREGRLDDSGGLVAYRRKVQHAGYTRMVISKNPPLYDGDGDPFSPVESDRENDRPLPEGVEPVEDDAFADVKLEELLRPLTNPAELAEHPGLRVAFTGCALTQMAEETMEMVRRERETLWKAKRLLLRFRGDGDWLPCGRFEGMEDEGLLDEDNDSFGVAGTTRGDDGNEVYGDAMDGVETLDMASTNGHTVASDKQKTNDNRQDGDLPVAEDGNNDSLASAEALDPRAPTDGMAGVSDAATLENPLLASLRDRSRDPDAASEHTSNSGRETNGTNGPSHSMTTRARARSPAASEPASPSPSDSASVPSINPWFLPPSSCVPDRDLGLPGTEAEETRRLLLLYVQKQENIVRSLESLYAGLQRTDRLRNEVYRASKAEGHLKEDGKGNLVTEMSDGEDWYDVSDWNLQPWELKVGKDGMLGLEKGKDEIEDVEEEGRRGAGRRRRVNRM